ncbi:MAG: hypothetical protein V7661_01350 [Sulfitobacter sp.]
MQALDSRNMGSGNCYMQKIIDKGELKIAGGKTAEGFLPIKEGKRTLTAKIRSQPTAVLEQDGVEVKQHIVPLRFKGNEFHLEAEKLNAAQGDMLIFHAADRAQPGFSVRGEIGKQKFSSTSLVDQAVFTHAFGLPGRYEWADANGTGVGGVITVVSEPGDKKDGADRAMKRMSEGILVHIIGTKVEPKELTISTGQTVFFAVEKTKGITITDVSLLKGKK